MCRTRPAFCIPPMNRPVIFPSRNTIKVGIASIRYFRVVFRFLSVSNCAMRKVSLFSELYHGFLLIVKGKKKRGSKGRKEKEYRRSKFQYYNPSCLRENKNKIRIGFCPLPLLKFRAVSVMVKSRKKFTSQKSIVSLSLGSVDILSYCITQ